MDKLMPLFSFPLRDFFFSLEKPRQLKPFSKTKIAGELALATRGSRNEIHESGLDRGERGRDYFMRHCPIL